MSLPPNWTAYKTEDGKEYYHNPKTGVTQWEKPEWPESTSEVYQYKPSNDLDLNDSAGHMVGMSGSQGSSGTGAAQRGVEDSETVSLRNAPTGQIGQGSSVPGVPVGGGGGGAGGGGPGYSLGQGIGGVFREATAEDGAGVSGIMGRLLASAQTLFDVGTDDVVKRLKASVIPMKSDLAAAGASNEFRARPDFWGPFWVATTAVLFLPATGNFSRLIDEGEAFKAKYDLVGLAASLVYGCLVGVPTITRVALCLTGQEADSINFRQMICVYGYSLTATIPVSILCILPSRYLRMLFTFVGLAISLLFIRSNLWADISVEAPSLKWTLVGLLCGSQAAIYGTYCFHFFSPK